MYRSEKRGSLSAIGGRFFSWEKKWDTVVNANFAASKGKVESCWFEGGKTNICYNAVDRHVADGHGDQICFYHEGNDEGDEMQSWTYAQVLDETKRLGNVLKAKGVKAGDCVSIFMPMVPQLPIAMLACANGLYRNTCWERLAWRMRTCQVCISTTGGPSQGTHGIFD